MKVDPKSETVYDDLLAKLIDCYRGENCQFYFYNKVAVKYQLPSPTSLSLDNIENISQWMATDSSSNNINWSDGGPK